MKDTERYALARSYENAWLATEGTWISVAANDAGWFTVRTATDQPKRVRAKLLFLHLIVMTGRLAQKAM
jgi:hypothetical protein